MTLRVDSSNACIDSRTGGDVDEDSPLARNIDVGRTHTIGCVYKDSRPMPRPVLLSAHTRSFSPQTWSHRYR